MSGEGRGSAIVVLLCLMLFMIMSSEVVQAATYKVGDAKGWTFNVESWSRGKRFRVGDILGKKVACFIVFNYNPRLHNLVIVNSVGYKNCNTPPGSRTFTSGNDRIKLVKGPNNFICSFPRHCQSAMKITVIAT
ncbi:basic blue protein-like [Impatiens glandulifera]|uniref:basic blue protein-like n=1 Tax=Impatiens glandulifera TaxID=253017 RepID=UPI001FB113D3|nr:basic blue protein-like [Impatiens glandulifera]